MDQVPVHHAAPPDPCHLLQRRHRAHRGISGVHQAGDLRRWRGRHRRSRAVASDDLLVRLRRRLRLLPHGAGNRDGLRSLCAHPRLHGAELPRPEAVGVLPGGASLMSELEQTPLVPAAALPVGVPRPPRRHPALPTRGFGSKLAAYLVVVLISIISLFPLYWMLENSLRTAVDAGANVTLVPKLPWQWSNYSAMWNYLPFPMSTFLINSFMLAGLVTVGTVISSALIAYGFARFRFPGREVFFAVIISTMMIPYAVMMIPQYALFINFFHWGSGG